MVTKLHIVKKSRKHGVRWYVYAWRGGPQIHSQDNLKPIVDQVLLDKASQARLEFAQARQQTLETVIQAYRASPEFAALAHETQRDYRLWLTRASQRFGSAPLNVFNDYRMRGEIMSWRDRWHNQPRTADKASVIMSILLGYAKERGWIKENVASGIPKLHFADKADLIWEDRHWSSVDGVPAHILDALKLASLTGLRLSDLVKLDWSEVGERAIVRVTQKRKARAVIPILPELRAHLDARPHRKGAVLRNSRGNPWTPSGLESSWQKKQPEAFDRTIHDLRGTYVTFLAVKGLTDEEIARIVGWTAKRVAEIRARYVDEERVVISLVDRLTA